jgi:hypothetical protein
MSKFSLVKINDKEFNIRMSDDNLINLELKPFDIELYKVENKYFFIKLKKTVFNMKMNKLIGVMNNEFINLINNNSYYFDSYVNFEKIFKLIEGNIILKVNKDGKNIDEIFYKDTKKIILNFNKLIVEEDLINGSIIRVIINYDLEKTKNLKIFSDFIFENSEDI